eukprot:symbB.v1.2.018967.t1/scaffold1530.1/size113418/3
MTFDVVLLGATGFTGKLACEYLSQKGGAKIAWAMAGRDIAKLEAVRDTLPEAAKETPLLKVDVKNEGDLQEMAKQAKVILNFAGTPYADKALPVVNACVTNGCCYVDITGEASFMKTSAEKYDAKAKETKALILHSCGFDSIPCDIAAFMAAKGMRERHGMHCSKIRNVVLDMAGGFSGGTIHSGISMLSDSELENADAFKDPYGMDPPGATRGPDTADGGDTDLPRWDELNERWVVMSPLSNPSCRTVRKSNALMNYEYGQGISYGEGMAVAGPVSGWFQTVGMGFFVGLLVFPPTRWALTKFALPSPGQGPSRKTMEEGYFTVRATARGANLVNGKYPTVAAQVQSGTGGDPGYKCTALMSVESALCCAFNRDKLAAGGVHTPASGLGQSLVDRLNDAGMKLFVEP